MAHEITERDGLALVGKPAWHGLGTLLPEGNYTPREALRVARLDWRVRVAPVFAETTIQGGPSDGQPVRHSAPEHRAVVREDTGDVLGVVSPGFSPVQNADLAELLQALDRPVETMGSLRGGRVVFALLRQGEFHVGAGDRVYQYLLAVNGHDGTRALSFLPTSVRVVCANTLRMAEGAGSPTVRMLHTSGLPERIAAASRALETAEALVWIQRKEQERLGATEWSEDALGSFLARTVEDIIGAPADSLGVAFGTGSRPVVFKTGADILPARAPDALRAIDSAYRHPWQAMAPERSAWRAFQAVSHWAHHARKGRQDAVESRLAGAVQGITSRAFRRALALSAG